MSPNPTIPTVSSRYLSLSGGYEKHQSFDNKTVYLRYLG